MRGPIPEKTHPKSEEFLIGWGSEDIHARNQT